MRNLYFNVNRSGYSPDQCYTTLNVRELKEILNDYDDDTLIYYANDNGYTFGEITIDDVYENPEWDTEDEDEDEDED